MKEKKRKRLCMQHEDSNNMIGGDAFAIWLWRQPTTKLFISKNTLTEY